MRVLGIETSCDETGIAIYDDEKGLLANQLYSQVKLHADYGGVVPELASRDHVRKTVPLIQAALKESGLTAKDIDAVAYTAGPGLVGALLVGATFLVKRIPGIKRAAVAPVLPTETTPFLLIDGGANNDCRPEMLVQFAIMGSAYMQNVMQVEKPRVALLNVGAEETKGRELELESYVQLSQAPVNFIGNIEARELPAGAADVVVTDGFTGNVALKLYEGMGKFMAHQMKGNLFAGAAGKLAALLILPKIKALTKKMDYKAVGGAVMLGVQKPVIKAHGSSDGTAFFNAIRQARDCVAGNVVQTIAENTGRPVKK